MDEAAAPRRIIVVDDDSSVLHTVQRQLDSIGWESYAASTAGEALTILGRLGRVDAVLTDVDMPVMDGESLRLEVLKRFPGTGVLLMSGGNDRDSFRVLEPPAIVLRKPFTVQALAAALETVCKRAE